MKALIWDGPGLIRLADVHEPTPGPDEAVVEVSATGVCGSEIDGYSGHMANRVPPLIMGHEFEGRVISAPDALPHLVGSRVAANPLVACGRCVPCEHGQENACPARVLIGVGRPGGFAERVAVPVRNLIQLPESLPPAAGALVEPTACVVHAFSRHGASLHGQDVLVLGAGSLGLIAVALARAGGARWVGAVDKNQDRLDQARRMGATATYLAGPSIPTDLNEALPEGPSLVLDTVGAASTKELAIRHVRVLGTVVLLGLRDDMTPVPSHDIIRREIVVRGTFAYSGQDLLEARDSIAGGRVPWEAFTTFRSIADGPAVFAELLDAMSSHPKVVFTMSS